MEMHCILYGVGSALKHPVLIHTVESKNTAKFGSNKNKGYCNNILVTLT